MNVYRDDRPMVCRRGCAPGKHLDRARYCYQCGSQLYREPTPKKFEFSQPLRVVQVGVKKCVTCGKPHNAHAGAGNWWGSWADPEDGHVYRHA